MAHAGFTRMRVIRDRSRGGWEDRAQPVGRSVEFRPGIAPGVWRRSGFIAIHVSPVH